MVNGGDAKLLGSVTGRKESPQDGIVGHVHVGHHGVPAFVVIPDLRSQICRNWTVLPSSFYNKPVELTLTLNSLSMNRRKVPTSLRVRTQK